MRRILITLLLAGLIAPLTLVESSFAAEPVKSLSKTQRAKAWLRSKFVRPKDLVTFGLKLDDNWQKANRDAPVVVLLHGFNSTADRNDALLAPVRDAGFPCATFDYPNDHALATSAELLSGELRRFGGKHPNRKIVLLTHSMGGLIARECVEDKQLDPGNVKQLIMVAPPNHGSQLARFACGTDIYEHVLVSRQGGPIARMRASIVDGLAEAADDLKPGSAFLTELNERPRNSNVRYSILLGTGGKVYPSELAMLRRSVRWTSRKVPFLDKPGDRCDAVLADFDEVLVGRGDGAVAIKRGKLKGVDDILVLGFGHMSVTGPPDRESVKQVHQAVLRRLKQPGVKAARTSSDRESREIVSSR